MSEVTKGIALTISAFVVFPIWMYLVSMMVSFGWHNGRFRSLKINLKKEGEKNHG